MPATHYYDGAEQHDLVTINGTRYKLAEPIIYNNLASLAGKVTFGDYTRDSDENTSSKIWVDFTGGIGIEHIREGSDEGSFWYGTLDGKTPFQLALNRETLDFTTVTLPLGDFNGTFYATDGTTFFTWDESTLAFTNTTYTVGATPVGPGVEWDGDFWVPLGASGLAKFEGAANATVNATVQAIDLLDFDGFLYAITTDRQMYQYDGTTWTSKETFKSPDTPRKLIVYMNRLEDDTLLLATNRGLLAWDKTNNVFIRTRFQVPTHIDNGRGVAVWRPGENLYYSAGTQVWQWNVGGTQPMGPGGKEGLPARLRGTITSFAPSLNALVALVEGASETVAVADDADLDEGMNYDDALYSGSTSTAVGSLMEFNGSGWHPVWESSGASGTAAWVVASSTTDHERLFWGYGDSLYSQKISKSSALPRQRWEAGEARFALTGSLDTGWFDGNMFAYKKTASHLEINLANVTTGAWVAVDYAIDNETDWPHTLGTITAADDGTSAGKAVLPFGVETITVDGVSGPFSRGLSFNRIRFRIRMESDDAEESPIVDSIVFKFVKQAQPYALYSLTIDLDASSEIMGRTASEIDADILNLLVADEFAWVRFGDFNKPVFRGLVTADRGPKRAGNDQRSVRTVSVIEYALEGYEGLPANYAYEP